MSLIPTEQEKRGSLERSQEFLENLLVVYESDSKILHDDIIPLFNQTLELLEKMYKIVPCDSEFSSDCTPCSYGDFLVKSGIDKYLNEKGRVSLVG